MILGFIFLIKNDAIFCKAVLVFSTSIICSLFIFGLELITKEAPFLKASSIKSFPSNLSPIIAINISSFFNDSLTILEILSLVSGCKIAILYIKFLNSLTLPFKL